jgi:hypothetical protein
LIHTFQQICLFPACVRVLWQLGEGGGAV